MDVKPTYSYNCDVEVLHIMDVNRILGYKTHPE